MLRDQPIKRKLMTVILLTSGAVLLLACGTFLAYELLTFRQTMVRNLSTLAQVVAANSTAALAFDNRTDATEVLSALSAERHIVAVGLYDNTGTLFAKYPDAAPDDELPARLERDGYQFARAHLVLQEPIVNANRRLGALVLKSDLGAMYERLSLYGGLVAVAIVLSCLVAFPLSNRLQRHISLPVLALADTAKAVSEGKDYSVRAGKFGDDELGRLTDAFNDMLAQIQGQDSALRAREDHLRCEVAERMRAEEEVRGLNASLEQRVQGRTVELAQANEALQAEVAEHEQTEEALKNNEDRLSLALDSGEMGAWELDLVHDTAIRTLKHDQIFGYQSLQPQWGAEIFMGHVFPEDREVVRKQFDEAFATDRLQMECRVMWKDHSLHWIAAHGLVHRDQEGAPLRMIGVVMDITQRKQAEEQIAQLNTDLQVHAVELAEANKELESFSYSVSHDLRAPLRHVQGYVEMLHRATEGQLSEQPQRYLKTITEASVEMGQLIDDLLAFSRMGRTEMTESRVPLDEVVQNTIRGLEMATTGRNIVWQTAPLPPVVGDPSLLKQVLTNLIGNAVKYSRRRDPGRIEIGCAGEEDGRIILFVRDNGAGFDMQYAHKLFGVFQRLHRAEEFEGTGIGLATVRRIVARHGGRVWAEGAVNQGATFYFTLKRSPSV